MDSVNDLKPVMTTQTWVEWYNHLISYRDPRTVGWFMVGSPFEGILICLLYVLLVTVVGPRFMKNREPYNVRYVMIGYNLGMVLLCAYTCREFLLGGWLDYSLGCQLVDTSTSPQAMRMVNVSYVFYICKFIELVDTFFFLARKKFHLITFLHVFHHSIMPCSWWVAVKFSPGGMGTFHALCNSFVHVVMYTYYGIAALGPQYQKYVWWKKYMTKLQMVQFVMVIIHASQLFFTDCPYPKVFSYWILSYALIFLVLFVNFYIQAYLKKRKAAASVSPQKSESAASAAALTKASGVANGSVVSTHESNGVCKPMSNGVTTGSWSHVRGVKED